MVKISPTDTKKKTKTPIASALKKLEKAQLQIKKIQPVLIEALFEQCPNIKSIELASDQDYDDNNYFEIMCLHAINGIEWDTETFDSNIDYLEGLLDDYEEDVGSWLVEANITCNDFCQILEILQSVSWDYIKSQPNMELKRENYIREEE